MLDLSQLEVQTEKETDNYGQFSIEPLDPGYGHTIGNALRRVLLTSLPGAAITQVKMAGVRHQFTSITSMAEDVVQFILNLKLIRLKLTTDKPVKLNLEVKGPKVVKAGNIEKAAGVEIINQDLVLANLADSKAKLSARLVAEPGTGYSLAEERRTGEIGMIPIDANFSPVVKVNYKIETTRVGRVANYDKIVIEITTDGTLKPSQALKQAAKILVDHFMVIYQPQTGPKRQKPQESAPSEDLLKTSLEELDLAVRLTNSLKSGGIITIGDFLSKDKKELMKMKNMGPKSIAQVEEKLGEKGIETK